MAFNQMIEYAKAHPKVKHIIFDITDRMTRKVKMGMQEKAEQNFYPSIAPLAYINTQNPKNKKDKKIEINEPQAQHLRRAFHIMATGNYSLKMLVIHLNDAGFRTNQGVKIHKSSLAHALKNPFYYGMFNWKGKQYQSSLEPLITKAVFDQIQRVLSGKHRPFINHKNFAFNNLIRCGICDCTVLGEEKRKVNGNRYVYYHCSFSKGRHEPREYIPENRLATLFEEPVRRVVITPEQAEWIKEGLAIRAQDARQSHEDRLATLQSQHDRVSQRLNKLFDNRMDGTIADETFARAKEAEYVAADVHEKAVILKKLASNYTLNDATPYPTYRRPFSIFAKGPSVFRFGPFTMIAYTSSTSAGRGAYYCL